jgi:predicted lactoylglutathione lyase
METETFIAWATSHRGPALSVTKPFDGNAATIGNGVMVALVMDCRDTVDSLYRKAIELGAKDEGSPGRRGDSFYPG